MKRMFGLWSATAMLLQKAGGIVKRVFGFIGIIAGLAISSTGILPVYPVFADTTYVSGIIDTNTVWDTTGTPYIVTGNVLVDSAVTLDIEPGVEVRIDSTKYIMIKGTLNAIGTATDLIIFTKNGSGNWDKIQFKGSSSGVLEYCIIEGASCAVYCENHTSHISNCSIRHNGTGVYVDYGSVLIEYSSVIDNSRGIDLHFSSATIRNNDINDNVNFDRGGGIYICGYDSGSSTISYNVIKGNSAENGPAICDDYSSVTIEHNVIKDNFSWSSSGAIEVYSYEPVYITNNIIINNLCWGIDCYPSDSIYVVDNVIADNSEGGISAISCNISNNTLVYNTGYGIAAVESTVIDHNTVLDNLGGIKIDDYAVPNFCNIFDRSGNYAIYNNSTWDIDATNNYWYTISTDSIDAWIYDYYDDFNLGKVNYNPILTSGDTTAPVPPPLNLTAEAFKVTGITLTWDSVPVADLAGYKVWYDTDTSGYPYNGIGANEGNSPIDVGNITTFELTGLTESTYYLAVTAYDVGGDSSWYSNEVIVQMVGVEERDCFANARNDRLEVYPNPFIRLSVIGYRLSVKSRVLLSIYDLTGRLVKTLVDEDKSAGYHSISWNARHSSSGIYFIKFQAGDFKATKKLTIIR